MECREVNQLMDRHLDRELDVRSADEVRGHVEACPACRRRWRDLLVLLSDPEPVELPAGLGDRIVSAWDRRQLELMIVPAARGGWWQMAGRLRYAGAIAACVLFFITGWILSGRWGGSQPGPIEPAGKAPAPVTVVMSPWVLSSMAQAAALPAPISPAVMLASGVVPEMMVPEPDADKAMPWIHAPAPSAATQPADVPGVPLLPILPRYPLGA